MSVSEVVLTMRSMTGFGRGESTSAGWQVSAELSGVNRKQIDVSVNLPYSINELEGDIRRQITESVSRGRINARIVVTHLETGDTKLFFDRSLASQYVEAAKSLSSETGIEMRMTAADLFRAPGVFKIEEADADPEELKATVLGAVESALQQLTAMQLDEGRHLREDLLGRLGRIEDEVNSVRELAPSVVETYRKNLFTRLSESGLEIDLGDDRILREIGIFAERSDITEEITRIGSHVGQFHKYLESDDSVGRTLDFLCQELNRELNTIGSKANDAGIAQCIVNAKTELEKIREQVQNVQ